MTVVLSIPGNEDHATKLGARLATAVITPEVRWFPDGEIYVRIAEDLRGHDAVIVGSLYPAPAEKFLMASFLAATVRDLGAQRVGLVAPYLAFMRQDVQFKPGEGVTSKYFGALVSGAVDWMVTVDPHLHRRAALEEIYTIPTRIAHSASEIAKWVAAEVERPVLVGPDAESVQWVRAVAEACGAPYVILEKTRRGDRDVSITAPQREAIEGKTPVLIDDIVSTGKTMVEATRQLVAAGSSPPMCIAIHAVFADDVHAELTAAGAAGIVTCNTIVHPSNRICVADPIADAAKQLLAR
ncbi:MAG: ribose-phosphate diphosphokinase [Deltaproteobacteria bacterium]|nr:ribose-phosphate diphosphokinase [Deltaproteobacteria bacterium]